MAAGTSRASDGLFIKDAAEFGGFDLPGRIGTTAIRNGAGDDAPGFGERLQCDPERNAVKPTTQ